MKKDEMQCPDPQRRRLIQGVSLALGSLPLQATADLALPQQAALPSTSGKLPPRRAIYQGLVYFDRDGTGEAWDQPAGKHATRAYINSISQETFLRRHWFT